PFLWDLRSPDHQLLLLPMLFVAGLVQFWSGWQFYRGAWLAARHATTDMNTLVAVGTSVAYVYGPFVTLFPGVAHDLGLGHDEYFDTFVIIIALVLVARFLE